MSRKGSELHLAIEGRTILQREGVPTGGEGPQPSRTNARHGPPVAILEAIPISAP
jgi:hypothetical protein